MKFDPKARKHVMRKLNKRGALTMIGGAQVRNHDQSQQGQRRLPDDNQRQPGPEFLQKEWVKSAIRMTAPITIVGSAYFALEGFANVVAGIMSGDKFLVLTGLAQTFKYLVFCVAAGFVWKNQTTNQANNQPSQQQLIATTQQNPIRRMDLNQPGELNNGWNTPRNRIVVCVMVLLSLGIGQTVKGLIAGNDQLISDGVYGTTKALGYVLATCLVLIGAQLMNQPGRRAH